MDKLREIKIELKEKLEEMIEFIVKFRNSNETLGSINFSISKKEWISYAFTQFI